MRRPGLVRAFVPLAAAAWLALALPTAGAVQWEDVAAQVGVRFVHSGPSDPDTDNRFPEATGSGACWSDVDQDGDDDLLLVNTPYWDGRTVDGRPPRAALFVNQGDGTFRDETAWSGLGFEGWGQGCAFGDYDGDGLPDLFLAAWGPDALFHNEGDGRFTDATAKAGVRDEGLCGDDACWGTSAAWLDHDRDGDLDLYVANYVAWHDGAGPPGPEFYTGQRNILWRNEGGGLFTDATEFAGVSDDPSWVHGKGLGVVVNDVDADGWPDIYVASDTVPNSLFRNRRDGTFTDVAEALGADDHRASMGVAWQDANGDGRPDLYLTHYQGEHNGFHLLRHDGMFEDHSGEGDLAEDKPWVGWGTAIADLDHDGHPDIYVVNGHTNSVRPDDPPGYRQARLFFRNDGAGGFVNASGEAGPFFAARSVGRGSALADYDWDGDLDIALNNNGGEAAELARASGAGGRWLSVLLRQPGGNRHAVGAELRATLDDGTVLVRTVQAGSGYLSQDSLAVHLGLGDRSAVEALAVRWPDGVWEAFPGAPADRALRLTRGGGVEEDVLGPVSRLVVHGQPGARGWWRSVTAFDAVAEDRGVTVARGVAEVAVRDPGTEGWRPLDGPVPLPPGDAVHAVWVRAVDRAGNAEGLWPRWVRVDATPPASWAQPLDPAGPLGWYRPPLRVAVEASDALSGVHEVAAGTDGDPLRPVAAPLVFAAEGAHGVRHTATDEAGNQAPVGEAWFLLDGTPPAASFAAPGMGAGPGSLRVEVVVVDARSGPALVRFHLDGEAVPRHVDATPGDGFTWDLAEPGLHRVLAVAVDGAGNEGAARSGPLLVLPPLPLPPGAALPLGAAAGLARRRGRVA